MRLSRTGQQEFAVEYHPPAPRDDRQEPIACQVSTWRQLFDSLMATRFLKLEYVEPMAEQQQHEALAINDSSSTDEGDAMVVDDSDDFVQARTSTRIKQVQVAAAKAPANSDTSCVQIPEDICDLLLQFGVDLGD